jgi:hypothetical protein
MAASMLFTLSVKKLLTVGIILDKNSKMAIICSHFIGQEISKVVFLILQLRFL